MSKLRGQWLLLCSRTQFRKSIIHKRVAYCLIYNNKLEKAETLYNMHPVFVTYSVTFQNSSTLILFDGMGSLCIGELEVQSHKRTADGGEK